MSFDAFHSTLLSQLSTNSTGYAYSEDKISPPAMVLGDSIVKVLSVNDYLLNPGANLRVEIHSEPQVVGSAVATSASDLQINAKIPNTIAPGVHTLHVYGVDINGKQVDIYKPVIIISSIDDIDGDGIVNDQDRCNFVQTTGIDQDYDGIDDSCDAYLPG